MKGFWEWLRQLFGGGRTGPSQRFVIAVDPGHGGKYSGATVDHPLHPGQKVLEKEITLQIGLKLAQLLRSDGHHVVLTRDRDTHLSDDLNGDLRQRADMANAAGAEVFVSIHCNSAENPGASGIETYHFPDSTYGRALANHIQRKLTQAFPDHRNRGVKAENFAVLRWTNMPACLVETEFLTHRESLLFLLEEQNQDRIAAAIHDGIYAYFGE